MCSSLSRKLSRAVAHLIVLTTVLSLSAGELITAPQSIESKVGDTTYFNCSTNLTSEEIFWHHGDKYIYTGDGILSPYLGRFEIDRNASDGSHNLVVHSVQPGDAGKYICIDDDGIGTRRSAELVVLGNDPDCQSNIHPDGVIGQNVFNIPPDEVQLTCNVTYHGNVPPRMEWKRVGDNSSIKNNVTSIVTSNNRLIYTMKFTGDIALDHSSYVCQTTRSTKNQYKCVSKTIKVLYFIGANMTQLSVVRGGEITCTASNNTFPCISQWYNGNYTCPLSCDDTITTHLLGEYLCTLKCIVRGKDYFLEALKAVVVEATTSPPPSKSGTIAALIVIPIVIIILVVLIAVCIVRRNKQKGEQNIQHAMRQLNREEAQIACLLYPDNVHKRGRRDRPRDKVVKEKLELLFKIKKQAKINESPIRGVAILDGKMFIVRDNSSNLEVYDCKNFSLDREFRNVNDLVDAVDICSCQKGKCLYIMDKKDGSTPKEVMKISAEGELLIKWSTEDNAGGYLSVTREGNVIVTVQYKHMLLEYSSDGEWLSDIKLAGHINPWHAIKVENDHYIVSHGAVFDSKHRVCLVDKDGKVQMSFGREGGSAEKQLNVPYYLAAASSGCVMVADLGNNRVLLLDSNLKFKANIVPKYKQSFRCPRRVYLDETLLVVVITKGNPEKRHSITKGNTQERNSVTKGNTQERNSVTKGNTEERNSVTKGNTQERNSAKVIYSRVETEETIDISTQNDALLKETEREKMIEEDCRLLVFDIRQILQKYEA